MRDWRSYVAECVGTAGLLCAVVGSGIMAENLSAGNMAVALLANTLATVFALYVLIESLGPVSGAHFNPVVSMVMAYRHVLPRKQLAYYVLAQLMGAALGVWIAHAMFDVEVLQFSTHVRSGQGQWLAEVVATAGLVFVILRAPVGKASVMVACYIGAAYWFTASTSFANPAAVFGRMMSNTFAGIYPADAPAFVVAEFLGAVLGVLCHRLLGKSQPSDSP
ncbi:MAG: aquaporin family protein [Betaproteobacteria bacterium]|nr:aquaporin family protein [Betaproteobacteria bacterium]